MHFFIFYFIKGNSFVNFIYHDIKSKDIDSVINKYNLKKEIVYLKSQNQQYQMKQIDKVKEHKFMG